MIEDHKAVYEAILAAQQMDEPIAVLTVIATQGSMPRHAGSKMIVYPDGRTLGTIGGGAMESAAITAALAAIDDGQTRIETYTLNSLDDGDPGICGGTAQIFIEPLGLAPKLLVIGGGHVGKALAELGKWAGFRVLLSDDREAFCNPDYLPDMDAYLICPPGQIVAEATIDDNTYIAAVTRGMPVDLELIPALLKTPAPYIGLIGSRRRWALTVEKLNAEYNLNCEELERIRAPIGLEIEAETPKEIAVSILAEIIMIRRGGTGSPMKTS